MQQIIFYQGKGVKKLALDPHTKIGTIIKEVTPALAELPDTLEDQEVYLLDENQELSKDDHVKDHKSFVVHRCKQIVVTVIYPGLEPFVHKYRPAALMKHIRKDAIEKFCLDGSAAHGLELFEKQDQGTKVNRNYPVGFYTDYPTCSIQLYLADPNAFAG
jgi:hypothetical protein